jgi:hypothetical protein
MFFKRKLNILYHPKKVITIPFKNELVALQEDYSNSEIQKLYGNKYEISQTATDGKWREVTLKNV